MRVIFLKILYPALALGSFVNPFWGLINYIFISIIRPEQLTHGVAQIRHVFSISIVCLVLSCFFHGIKLMNFRHSFFLFYLLYILAFFISTFTSSYTDFTDSKGSIYYLYQLPQIMVFCLCLFGFLFYKPLEYLDRLLEILLFFFFFMALWGIQQRFNGNILMEHLFGNSITDRNAIAGVYLLQLGLVFYFIKIKKGWVKTLNILYALVFVAMVIFTQSRAGFLGLCGIGGVLAFQNRKQLKLQIGLFICVILFLLFPQDFYSSRMSSIRMQDVESADNITDYSSASRLVLWSLAIDIFTDNPIIGVGNLNFRDAGFEYATQYKNRLDPYLYSYVFSEYRVNYVAHNTYLSILSEVGLAGGVPFFLMIITSFTKGRGGLKNTNAKVVRLVALLHALRLGLFGFLITAFFSNQIYLDFMYWFLTLSFMVATMIENIRLCDYKKRSIGLTHAV